MNSKDAIEKIKQLESRLKYLKDNEHIGYDEHLLSLEKLSNELKHLIKDTEDKNPFNQLINENILDSSVNAIAIANLNGELTYVNNSFIDLWGYSNKQEVIGTHSTNYWISKVKAEEIIKTLDTSGSWKGEMEATKKDKTNFIVQLSAGMIYNDKNKPIYMMASFDITERKKAEIALKISEERFRKLFEDSADATLIIENNQFVDCNLATLKMLRMESKEQFVVTHPSILSPKNQPDGRSSRKKAEEMMNIAFKEGSNRFEWVHKRSDGELFYAEVLLTPIEYEEKHLLYCVWRDISNRKAAEKALKDSEERYKSLFEQAADGILIGNSQGTIIGANHSISNITGYSMKELIGQTITILFPQNVLTNKPLRYDLVEAGESVLAERKLQKKDGSIITIEMNTRKVHDGRLQAYIRDITERKQQEEHIKDKNHELNLLNERLKQQTNELKIAKEKAEESDRLKSAFLANMSHEIRTPMNGILGFAELLKTPELSGEAQSKYIEIIEQSGNRMLNIINDLIDISKIEAGQLDLHLEQTNINDLFSHLYVFFAPETQKKNLKFNLSCALPHNESIIKTDKTKLSQIISNLIKNAIKFTDAGKINIGYNIKNNEIEFFIEDSGIGISTELQDVIFERFRQAEIEVSSPYEGAGLGLSISKAYVKLLGGDIHIESEPTKGSKFIFTIPFIRENKLSSSSSQEHPETQTKKLNILVVDDDETSRFYITEALKREPIQFLHASDGHEAIDMVNTNKIDIILMDIKMPRIDGYSATKIIKETHPNITIIAQTANAMDSDRQKALNAGCDDYISKPIKKTELIKIINTAK